MNRIDVGKEFHFRLVNRDKYQGDGEFNANKFRNTYLKKFDSKDVWDDPEITIILDFLNVRKIGPSFANEAFAYFMKYVTPKKFYSKIKFENLTEVMKMIIDIELKSGYSR